VLSKEQVQIKMAKRGKLEIIKDILSIVHENHNSIKITPLLRKSNMSSSRFKEYFQEMIIKGFIQEVGTNDGKRIILTNKGFKFVEKYKTIIEFIEEFDL
jgi:predicted transcriptional regulator